MSFGSYKFISAGRDKPASSDSHHIKEGNIFKYFFNGLLHV